MRFLVGLMRTAIIAQKTLSAVGAAVIITVGVHDYLKKRKK